MQSGGICRLGLSQSAGRVFPNNHSLVVAAHIVVVTTAVVVAFRYLVVATMPTVLTVFAAGFALFAVALTGRRVLSLIRPDSQVLAVVATAFLASAIHVVLVAIVAVVVAVVLTTCDTPCHLAKPVKTPLHRQIQPVARPVASAGVAVVVLTLVQSIVVVIGLTHRRYARPVAGVFATFHHNGFHQQETRYPLRLLAPRCLLFQLTVVATTSLAVPVVAVADAVAAAVKPLLAVRLATVASVSAVRQSALNAVQGLRHLRAKWIEGVARVVVVAVVTVARWWLTGGVG